MPKRATKQEAEWRVAQDAKLASEGKTHSSITSLVAKNYEIAQRRRSHITPNAYIVLKDDIEEG